MTSTDPARLTIDTIRVLAMDAVQKANAGHPGTAMALAPVAYLLYAEEMRHDPSTPDWPGRDRFILSAGHACILQYVSLHLSGYDVTMDDLQHFRQWGSRTPGHPELGHTPGIETTTGPLGQGFANGVGLAVAQRFLADRWNRPHHALVDSWVYAICSDGDMMEGVTQESASIAGQLGLGRLVYVYDDNHITIDGSTTISFTREDKGKRFEAYGWHVQHVDDPNDLDALRAAFAAARAEEARPSLDRSPLAHRLPGAATRSTRRRPTGRRSVRTRCGGRRRCSAATPTRRSSSRTRCASTWPAWASAARQRARRGRSGSPHGRTRIRTPPPSGHATCSGVRATAGSRRCPRSRPASRSRRATPGKTVMQALKRFAPTLIGGAADLVESTKTEFEGGGVFAASHAGRNIPFGIREHGMGSIVNGIALEPAMLRPYGSTFFVFSDYMRPAVRLSAISQLPVTWIWTHDSIGLGEDGPTHQPVEHLMALRAIPNLWLVRPGDANETVAAWRIALERDGGPVGFALSRQKLPVLGGEGVADTREGALRGGYVLWQRDPGSEPDAIVVATGSELSIALDGARSLDLNARVVSLPCWELFDEQPDAYRDEVLPPSVEARVSIEAGVTFGWEHYVGVRGTSLGVDRFGASAPYERIYEELGLTPKAVADAVARVA